MIAIRALQTAGVGFTADFLQRFGFKRDQYFASEALALGAASFTPLEWRVLTQFLIMVVS